MKPARSKRVLVVDDEKIISRMIRALLEQDGYTVETVQDGQMALHALPEFEPDLIIMDVMMPKENGYRVSRKIKMLGQIGGLEKIPKILMVTARDLSHDKDREEGMNAYSMSDGVMYKPFQPRALLAKVRSLTS